MLWSHFLQPTLLQPHFSPCYFLNILCTFFSRPLWLWVSACIQNLSSPRYQPGLSFFFFFGPFQSLSKCHLLNRALSNHLKCNFQHSFSLFLNFSPLHWSLPDILCVFLTYLLNCFWWLLFLLECKIKGVIYYMSPMPRWYLHIKSDQWKKKGRKNNQPEWHAIYPEVRFLAIPNLWSMAMKPEITEKDVERETERSASPLRTLPRESPPVTLSL